MSFVVIYLVRWSSGVLKWALSSKQLKTQKINDGWIDDTSTASSTDILSDITSHLKIYRYVFKEDKEIKHLPLIKKS